MFISEFLNRQMASLTNDAEIRAYLQGHGIPQFIDQFIRKVVQEQPQDFKPVLRAMLKSGQRQSGKGSTILSASDDKPTAMKSSAMSGESGPPDYCLRDPKVRPSAEQAKSKGAVTWPNTRSEILEPNLNKDYGTKVQLKGCARLCLAGEHSGRPIQHCCG